MGLSTYHTRAPWYTSKSMAACAIRNEAKQADRLIVRTRTETCFRTLKRWLLGYNQTDPIERDAMGHLSVILGTACRKAPHQDLPPREPQIHEQIIDALALHFAESIESMISKQ